MEDFAVSLVPIAITLGVVVLFPFAFFAVDPFSVSNHFGEIYYHVTVRGIYRRFI